MKLLKRRDLPSYFKLPLKFPVDKLISSYTNSIKIAGSQGYRNSFNALRAEYSKINQLTEMFDFSSYDQVDLTNFSSDKHDRQFSLKNQLRGGVEKSPLVDERNYNQRNDLCDIFLHGVFDSFQAKVTRCRFAKLNAGSNIAAHVDYDTDFSIRIHIPIITNPDVTFYVARTGTKQVSSWHMPADGHAWFINQGMLHWVENKGKTDRVHLVISLCGQEDLHYYNVV